MAAYVDRDSCPLPNLVSGGRILPVGTAHSCAHYAWVVQWGQDWGGTPQPRWVCAGLIPAEAP